MILQSWYAREHEKTKRFCLGGMAVRGAMRCCEPQNSIVEEEVPVYGDFRRALRAPAETKDTFACFFATRFRFTAMHVPHAESDVAGGVYDDFVLLDTAADVACVPVLLLRVDAGIIRDVDVGVLWYLLLHRGDERRTAGLGHAHVLHDTVRESGGEGHAFAVGRAMDAAAEV